MAQLAAAGETQLSHLGTSPAMSGPSYRENVGPALKTVKLLA